MDSPNSTQESGSSKKIIAEAILKHDSLLGVLMELEDTDAGKAIATKYFNGKGINDPSSHGLLPLIQMKTGVLLMFPYVSYLHRLWDSDLHCHNLPDDWKAKLDKGKKCSKLTGTAKAVAIVRHSIAHLLEGESGNTSKGDQAVNFDSLSFHADIGSITFQEPEGYLGFFEWLRKTSRKRASSDL
ncbi:hypothetical protein [Synechococcus sp. BMK-MC-1]|uniref:hypothetical protein n=1 Tax=Synechococcus sp. BMK-MC-1 TaxID=1442551 RepID=UPI001644A26C|nr:hypothetical protein [Synechococcus sp. BMK-MC-1]